MPSLRGRGGGGIVTLRVALVANGRLTPAVFRIGCERLQYAADPQSKRTEVPLNVRGQGVDAVRYLIALLVFSVAGFCACGEPANAVDPAPHPRDATVIQDCLMAKGLAARDREKCIDIVANPCMGPDAPAPQPPSNIIQCFGREQLVWDGIIEQVVSKLKDGGLDDDQRAKLQGMQRAWLEDRDKSCAFYHDFFQGTLANPMMANCLNRETARRAIFLKGFADEIAASPSK
jgi:uncharacterized protein YecT (DUF1311 family)